MKARDCVQQLLIDHAKQPQQPSATAFAPTNIALCKYWGKRDKQLNLPVTSSLSVSLPGKGTQTTLSVANHDHVSLNGETLDADHPFYQRLFAFLNLIRDKDTFFNVETENNIPTAAGLASSASGFAALVKVLDQLYDWQLPLSSLSLLARLGSGSACRSLWEGFVEWQRGERADGLDSIAAPVETTWPGLCLGLLIFKESPKPMSSREAMNITTATSPLYMGWPQACEKDLALIHQAIATHDFHLLGTTVERNALLMHSTMQTAQPPITYATNETYAALLQVWQLRQQGLAVYATQDAGPNLKLLFEAKDHARLIHYFPRMETVSLF